MFCIVHFQVHTNFPQHCSIFVLYCSPSLSLPHSPSPISPLSLNLTSKVFLGNTFFPLSIMTDWIPLFCLALVLFLFFSVHHSFCKISTILLNLSPLSSVHTVPNATFFCVCVWSPPSTSSHIICAPSTAFTLARHLNVLYTWLWGVSVSLLISPMLPSS